MNELIKENNNLKNQKLITNEDLSLNGVKSDYFYVKSKLNEYKSTVDNMYNKMILNQQSTNDSDKETKILNKKFDEWIN